MSISASPHRSRFMPAKLADIMAEIETSDATTTLRVGYVLGAVAWIRVAGGETVTLPRLNDCRCRDTVASPMADRDIIAGLTALGLECDVIADDLREIRGLLESEKGQPLDMAALETLRASVASLRDKVAAAKARVADQPELTEVAAQLDAIGADVDAIDPDVPTGGIVADGEGIADAPASGDAPPSA